jgi:hypothetical protein
MSITALTILVINGSLKRTIYFRIILLFGLLILLPAFEILPTLSKIIFPIAILGIPIVYTISFVLKKNKVALDRIKIFWVWLAFLGALFKILHLPTSEEISFVGDLYLIAMTLYFLARYYRPAIDPPATFN